MRKFRKLIMKKRTLSREVKDKMKIWRLASKKNDKVESLNDLFIGYSGNYTYHDIDTGGPVGDEM